MSNCEPFRGGCYLNSFIYSVFWSRVYWLVTVFPTEISIRHLKCYNFNTTGISQSWKLGLKSQSIWIMITIVRVEVIVIITLIITLEAIIFENLLCAMGSARHTCYLSFQISDSSPVSQMEVHLRSAGFKVRWMWV